MFVSVGGFAPVVTIIACVVLTVVLAAHLVWVWQIARSPALANTPKGIWVGIVVTAVLTPVVRFYAVEIAKLTRPGTTRHRLFGIVAAFVLGLAGVLTAALEGRYAPGQRAVRLGLELLPPERPPAGITGNALHGG